MTEFAALRPKTYSYLMDDGNSDKKHWVKSVQIRSCFLSVFSCIRTEYVDLRSKSPYSIQIQENTDQK